MEIKPEWWRMGLEYFIWTSIFPLSQNYSIYWTSKALFSQYNSYYWTSMPILSHYHFYYWTSMPILSQSKSSSMSCRTLRGFFPGKMTISEILEDTHFQKVCISLF